MSDTLYEIFISYARKDNRPIPPSSREQCVDPFAVIQAVWTIQLV